MQIRCSCCSELMSEQKKLARLGRVLICQDCLSRGTETIKSNPVTQEDYQVFRVDLEKSTDKEEVDLRNVYTQEIDPPRMGFTVNANGKELTKCVLLRPGLIMLKAEHILNINRERMDFTVGGVDHNSMVHFEWFRGRLDPGDRIEFVVDKMSRVAEPKYTKLNRTTGFT